jgi:hypothetical protein
MEENELIERNTKYIENIKLHLFTNIKLKIDKMQKIVQTGNFNSTLKVPWYIILPNQRRKRLWDILVCLCCIISLSLVTIDISWNIECMSKDRGYSSDILYTTLSVIYFIDILLSFITAKLDKNNNYSFDLKTIAVSYLFNGFIFEFVSSLPYNKLFEFDINDCYQPYIPNFKYLYLFFYLRINRINRFFGLIEKEFSNYANYIRLIKLFSIIIFLANFAGNIFCGNSDTVIDKWIYSSCQHIPKSSPEFKECLNDISTENLASIYFYALFMGITMTLGNDFETKTITERVILTVTFVVSTILNATIYGNVAVMLSNVSHGLSPILREKIDTMDEYMKFMKFDEKFINIVEEYHINIWYKQRNMMYEETFFDDMSVALRKSLLIQQWKNSFLLRSQFLPLVSEKFVIDMIVMIKPRIFMTHDVIITEGEKNTEVYLTSMNAKCKVYIGGQWIKNLNGGDYFGEIAIFLRSRRRTATVYSMSTSDILVLEGKSFEMLLRNYPEDYERIKKNAMKSFIESMKFYPSSLFAKLVPSNNLKDYLFRKNIYLDDEEEDELLDNNRNNMMDVNEYEQKLKHLKEKLEGIKNKLDNL